MDDERLTNLLAEEIKLEQEAQKEAQQKARRLWSTTAAANPVQHKTTAYAVNYINKLFYKFIDDTYTSNNHKHKGSKPKHYGVIRSLVSLVSEDTLADKLSLITASVLTQVLMAYTNADNRPIAYSTLCNLIGREIRKEHRYLLILKNLNEDERRQLTYGLKDPQHRDRLLQEAWRRVRDNIDSEHTHPPLEYAALAIHLVDIYKKVSGFFEVRPIGPKHLMLVVPTEEFIQRIQFNTDVALIHVHKFLPMIVPPKRWTGFYEGGYLTQLNCTLIRLHNINSPQSREYIKNCDSNFAKLATPLKAIHALQETPWKINKEVLFVLKQLKNCNNSLDTYIESLPQRIPKPTYSGEWKELTSEAQDAYKQKAHMWYANPVRVRLDSLFLRAVNSITIAEKYAVYPKIYFTYSMDFRGRVYPIPNFSPQGADLDKGLLLLAETPTWTEENVDDATHYFYITGANLAGVDKVSYDERVEWTLRHTEDLLASANDPLANRFWTTADEPVQFLAYCFEFRKLIEYRKEHGSLVGFTTGLPYAADGTCSGLQHYSAILRDPIGADAVNLINSEKPHDIYGVVADKVNEILSDLWAFGINSSKIPSELKDQLLRIEQTCVQDKGINIQSVAQAWFLYLQDTYGEEQAKKGITRKEAKRPIMTLCYGASKYGYTDMVIEDTIEPYRAKKAIAGVPCSFTTGNRGAAARLMSTLLWYAAHQVVKGATAGMNFIRDIASILAHNNTPMKWTTPSGFPVLNNYIKKKVKKIMIDHSGKRSLIYDQYPSSDIAVLKEINSAAPNFIHSMDASHLHLTIEECVKEGIKHFITVHDSYGCDMSNAAKLNKIVREQFFKHYSEHDVLKELQSAAANEVLEAATINLPIKGDLDLESVLTSDYIFS